MRSIRLIAATDEFDNTPGLIIKGTPRTDDMMADREGGLIAHDLLEHQNGAAEIGSVWDELEALGGVWQVRGRHGDMCQRRPSYHSPAVNIASDVTRMFQLWLDQDCYEGPRGLRAGSKPHDYDDDFNEIINIARRDIPREYTDIGRGDPGEDENGWTQDTRDALEAYLTLALHRMRVGFRKAQKRFGSHFAGHSLYCAVRDAVTDAAKDIDYEGQEFILRYGNGEATCTPVYEDDSYA